MYIQTSFFFTGSKSGIAKTRLKATHVSGTKGVSKTQGTVHVCVVRIHVTLLYICEHTSIYICSNYKI